MASPGLNDATDAKEGQAIDARDAGASNTIASYCSVRARKCRSPLALGGAIDSIALAAERGRQLLAQPRLVLDDQNAQSVLMLPYGCRVQIQRAGAIAETRHVL